MFALDDHFDGLPAAVALADACLDEAEVACVSLAYLGEGRLPTDKFSSCSKSSSSLKALSFIIITMDLTPEQVDQIVALEMRKLERDYNATIAADGKLDRLATVAGTPNLDAIVAEAQLAKMEALGATVPQKNGSVEAGDDGRSWETDEEDDGDEAEGFQRLQDEDDDDNLPDNGATGESQDKSSAVEQGTKDDSPQVKVEVLVKKEVVFEEVIIQPRQSKPADVKEVQNAMAKINFPAPEWAKK